MSNRGRVISLQTALDHVHAGAFTTGDGVVGAEVEWLVVDERDHLVRPALDRVEAAAAAATRTRVTYEPGGQLELSSAPGTIATVCDAIAGDEAAVASALHAGGLTLHGTGIDPRRGEGRLVDRPRYAAMETYFDTFGPEGRRMMCNTAAIQINVDAGAPHDIDRRWRLAHAAGPTLIAAFANSPIVRGAPTGWRSTRMANWWWMDPTRTWPARPSDSFGPSDGSPRGAFDGSSRAARDEWVDYVMRARVMMIRRGEDFTPVTAPMTFAEWIEHGHELGFPTLEDLDYHATTLFPPVRARGWLELRFLDAQDSPWWRAATGLVVAMMNDPAAADRVERATQSTAGLWTAAARDGLSHPMLAASARECFDAALDALPRAGADPETIDAAQRYVDRYVARSRCPADDALDALQADEPMARAAEAG